MTETKDATVTTRLSAEEKTLLEAKAEAEGVSVGVLVRRGIKAVLAGTAVLVAALTLTACGSTLEPSAPQATVPQTPVAQVQDAPEATASEAECYAYYVDGALTPDAAAWIERFNGLPSINENPATAIVIYQALLDDAPAGPFCTADDEKIATELSGQLEDSIADAEKTLAG